MNGNQWLILIVVLVIFLLAAYYIMRWIDGTDGGTESARYMIKFVSNWGSNPQEIRFPPNPHTGNMFLAVHNDKFGLFTVGGFASRGIAETSMFGTIDNLLENMKNPNIKKISTSEVISTPGEKTFIIEPDQAYHYFSFSTMIAPSADWFTAVSKINLIENGKWIQEKILPLFAYDAGSDAANKLGFTDKHIPRDMPLPITPLTSQFLFPDKKVKPIAMLLIKKIN